ncbi:MAG TPA: hypothetical protein VGM77_02970 [Gemmatimonadales bacterium]|jgi:hypothetical protein
MPITLSFDFDQASVTDPNDRTRVQVAFSRFGWEHIGGSSWRYPKLDQAGAVGEDWFNCVIPALVYFRALVEHGGIRVTKFTLDAHSEAGFRSGVAGTGILPAAKLPFQQTGLDPKQDTKLSEARLRKFFKAVARAAG